MSRRIIVILLSLILMSGVLFISGCTNKTFNFPNVVLEPYEPDSGGTAIFPDTRPPDDKEPLPPNPPEEPVPGETNPVNPDPEEPAPVEPEPEEPTPTDPGPVEPDPAEPNPEEPDPVEPGTEEPAPTEPDPTDPDPAEPPAPPEIIPEPMYSLDINLDRINDCEEMWENATIIDIIITEDIDGVNPYPADCRIFAADGGIYFSYISYDTNLIIHNILTRSDFVMLKFTVNGTEMILYIGASGIIYGNEDNEYEIAHDYAGTFNDTKDDYGWGTKAFIPIMPDDLKIEIIAGSNCKTENSHISNTVVLNA